MKTIFLKTIMMFVSVTPLLAYAASKTQYDCTGMDSHGKKINSQLTIFPTKKENVYHSIWTYTNPKSAPDEGTIYVLDKHKMIEKYQSKTGSDQGETELYSITDKELVIHHIHFDKQHKIQFTRTGYCTKTSS